MKMHPYLSFNGNCEAAMTFYAEHLGGQVSEMHRFGNSPMADQVGPDAQDKIMHVSLTLADGQMLMASDVMDANAFQTPQGITLSLNTRDSKEAEKVFAALAQNGKVLMPLEKTFWAELFGMVTDQFGTPWMINCEAAQA